jgi:hypothetical protein
LLGLRGMMRFLLGLLTGLLLAGGLATLAQEPSVTIKNGVLRDWIVTRDDETLLCEEPMVFVRARQIQCP